MVITVLSHNARTGDEDLAYRALLNNLRTVDEEGRKEILSGYAPKGSDLAKAKMRYLRSLRGKTKTGRKVKGGIAITSVAGPIAKLLVNYYKGWHEESKGMRDELARLRALKAQREKEKGGTIIDRKFLDKVFLNEHLRALRTRKLKEKGGMISPAYRRRLNLEEMLMNNRRTLSPDDLLKKRGGKFELRDLRDFFGGPQGWIRMGIRKKRQKEIDALKKELGEA